MVSTEFDFKNFLYLDFETDTKKNFFLVGVEYQENFQHTILTPKLLGLSNEYEFNFTNPNDFVFNLLEGLEEKAIIVAYSINERDIIREVVANDARQISKEVYYINLLKVAKKWIRNYKQKEFDELPPFRKDPKRWGARKLPNSLASLMRLTDFHAPADYAPGKTSTKFKTVCDALEKRGQTYSLLTKAQKKKATEVLKHNQFDVEAMRVLTEIIYNTDCDLFYRQIKPLFE